jgi:outer membrane immunogenic protein
MPIRLEGEVFTLSNDADYTFADGDRGKGGSTYTGFLANVYYDIENKSDFTPYLGGGLGYTGAELNDDFGEDLSDNVFAWHLDFGVAYAAADNFFIDLQYRYFDASSASDNYSTVGDIAGVSWDFSSNIIMIGLRYEFK